MRNLFHILFFLIPLITLSQVDTVAHLHTFGGFNNDNAEEIEATNDGGYIIIGSTSSNSSGNTDVYLLKVDSLFNYEWSWALGGTNNDWGYSVKQTFDKGFIIAGTSNSNINGGYNAMLMKRDSLGGFVWRKTYGGQDWDFAYSVVQTYDSGYVFCGETYNNSFGFSDVYIVKTNPLGDTLWTKTMGGALIDKGNSVIETSDSNIVVAGLRNTVLDSTEAYIIKLTSNGSLLFDSIYGTLSYDALNDIIETQDGGFVGAGASTGINIGSDKDIYFFKVDNNGNYMWGRESTYNVSVVNKDDEGFGVIELSNGQLFVTGSSKTWSLGEKDVALYLLSSFGWPLSGTTFGGSKNDFPKSITLGRNDDLVIAGTTKSFGSGNEDVFLIRLDTFILGMDTAIHIYDDNIVISLSELDNNVDIKVFPNPSSGVVNFRFNKSVSFDNCNLRVYDLFGRIIIDKDFDEDFMIIDLEPFCQGIYTYRFIFDNQKEMNGNLIVK